MLLSNRKNIAGSTNLQSFNDIGKIQTKKHNNTMAVTDYEENSIGIEEIDTSMNHIGDRKQSTTS